MKVKTIKGAWGIPIAYDRKFLGFRLIYKGYMENMPNGYEGNFPKPKYKLTQWISEKAKKFVQKLFPDYVVETKAQYNARLEANHNSEMEGLTWKRYHVRYFDEDIKKMENMMPQEKRQYELNLRRNNQHYYDGVTFPAQDGTEQNIKFLPEDVEKLKHMSAHDMYKFMDELEAQKRFIKNE